MKRIILSATLFIVSGFSVIAGSTNIVGYVSERMAYLLPADTWCPVVEKDFQGYLIRSPTAPNSLTLISTANANFLTVAQYQNLLTAQRAESQKEETKKSMVTDNATTPNNESLLCLAAKAGKADEVKSLLTSKDADERDTDGRTALMWAAGKGHLDIANLLLEAGANINATEFDGTTPLVWAAGSGHTNIVQRLLQQKATVNLAAEDGSTALMLAAGEGHADVVKILIAAGADLNIRDEDGETALTWAQAGGRNDVIEVLKAAGAIN